MLYKEIIFDSYEEFHSELFDLHRIKDNYKDFVFRGVDSSEFTLLPRALRMCEAPQVLQLGNVGHDKYDTRELKYYLDAEYGMLKNFYQIANDNGLRIPKIMQFEKHYKSRYRIDAISMFTIGDVKWITDEFTEIAALAQHYGLPTRMIDFTFDIFVALYFATCSLLENDKQDGYFSIWALNRSSVCYLYHPDHRIPLDFVVPRYAENPNLNAQSGLFVSWEYKYSEDDRNRIPDRSPIEEMLKKYEHVQPHDTLLYKFIIPKSEALKIMNQLSSIGYTAARMFPGYSGAVDMMFEQIVLSELNKSNMNGN